METLQSETRVRDIYNDLKDVYGDPDSIDDTDGVRQLLVTILSQNVADQNTERAAERLFTEYSDYREIENADLEELKEVINPAGLPDQKARRIQRSLQALREHTGKYSVDFLGEMDDREAKKWLEQIKGVGPKTASVLLNFHFEADVMPVDTHVERVAKRFQLVPFNASNSKAHDIMNDIVPHDLKHPMHVLMIEHGRSHCSARNPSCGETKLKKYCLYYENVIDGAVEPGDFPEELLNQ